MPGPRRTALIAGAGVVVMAVGIAVVVAVNLAPREVQPTAEGPAEVPRWAPAAGEPLASAAPGVPIASEVDAEWAAATAAATGIPERAVLAYAGAALRKSSDDPECRIAWNTLAGIGAVESDHGRYGGSALDAAGNAVPPIYGIALTGETTNRIPDTDGGALDGDAEWDRAVGPMQLLPGTWVNWLGDADANGVSDPQNIDDAVFAASSYLCSRDPDMATEEGWRAAITSYNDADSYIGKVATAAVRYAEAVPGGTAR